MNSEIESLEKGSLSLGLAPESGGAIAWLKWNGVDLLRPLHVQTNDSIPAVRLSSAYPLVPYSNRIADGKFSWDGKAYTLAKNFGEHPHSIHGFGWQRSWKIEHLSKDAVTMGLVHYADHDWPWDCKATQSLRLTENSVLLTITLTNLSHSAMPAGLGWHPFFLRSQLMKVQFSSRHFWTMNDRNLPDQMIDIPESVNFCDSKTLGYPNLDNCYSGWDGKVIITYPEHELLVQVNAHGCDYLVFFTPHDKNFCAIEPVTHLNNAINLHQPEQLGIKQLNPNEHMTLSIEMVIEKA